VTRHTYATTDREQARNTPQITLAPERKCLAGVHKQPERLRATRA